MTKKVIYPGSFDPVTYGHIDLIKRALKLFQKVVVAVAASSPKETLFSLDERIALIRRATSKMKGVEVDSFEGLSIEYVKKKGAFIIIRGLRMISDFEYEFQMALTNRRLNKNIETMFLMPNEAYSYLSSRLIKEAASLGADVSCFIPLFVANALKKKIAEGRRSC